MTDSKTRFFSLILSHSSPKLETRLRARTKPRRTKWLVQFYFLGKHVTKSHRVISMNGT